MSLTNFEKVIEFSNTAEIPHFTKPQTTITKTSPKVVDYRMSLIREEVEELEDAVYSFEQIDKDLETKKNIYQDSKKNPNKIGDLGCNKLIDVKEEQSVNNKKLYFYEILGLDKSTYKKMIDMCIYLRNSKIDNIDPTDENSKNIDIKNIIKYNNSVNEYFKSMLDTLQNKKIVYKIEKTVTNKKDKLKAPGFYFNNERGRLNLK